MFRTWEILDVLVLGVDDLGELLAVDHLLEDPHVDLLHEHVRVLGGVLTHQLCDGGAPIPGTHDADLLGRHAILF